MDRMEQLAHLWNNIVDLPRLTGNGYRVLIDIAVNFDGRVTQEKFLKERSEWKRSSLSNTLRRLVESEMLLCKPIPKMRKMEYVINSELLEKKKEIFNLQVDFETFLKIWDKVREMTFMSANTYRVFIDVLLFYTQVSPKELCEERKWKVSPTYASFKKMEEKNLLCCMKDGKQTIYKINKKLFLDL